MASDQETGNPFGTHSKAINMSIHTSRTGKHDKGSQMQILVKMKKHTVTFYSMFLSIYSNPLQYAIISRQASIRIPVPKPIRPGHSILRSSKAAVTGEGGEICDTGIDKGIRTLSQGSLGFEKV